MKQFLIDLSLQRRYWLALVMLGVLLESAALYSQYLQGEWPCVLCIHIRIWIIAFIILAVVALLVESNRRLTPVFHLINTAIMVGFVERSWQTLAVERGWVFGDCDMESGLPPWFALDQWLPEIFEVQTACGYTPLVVFNITMAELLLVFSSSLLGVSLVLLTVSLRRESW